MGTRRAELLGIKLKTLAANAGCAGASSAEIASLPRGAALIVGDEAWVLLDGDADAHLGAVIAWSVRRGASRLHVIADEGAGVAARRAGEFTLPIEIWRAREREVERVAAQAPTVPVTAPPEHLALADMIVAGGAEVVVEHGVVAGEVRGLEVCRVVDGVEGPQLDIGIGANDREAFRLLHGERPTLDALADVVSTVARHRQVGAEAHPFNRLARERFVRWRLIDDPGLIDATAVAPAEPPVARRSVTEVTPCLADAVMADGTQATVVCSAGVDLELVPYTADARRALGRTATGIRSGGDRRLMIVVPARDRLAILGDLLALLDQAAGWSPPEVVSLA